MQGYYWPLLGGYLIFVTSLVLVFFEESQN
jgi:hypothetical protein